MGNFVLFSRVSLWFNVIIVVLFALIKFNIGLLKRKHSTYNQHFNEILRDTEVCSKWNPKLAVFLSPKKSSNFVTSNKQVSFWNEDLWKEFNGYKPSTNYINISDLSPNLYWSATIKQYLYVRALTPSYKVFIQMVILVQLGKKVSAFVEGLLPCWQTPCLRCLNPVHALKRFFYKIHLTGKNKIIHSICRVTQKSVSTCNTMCQQRKSRFPFTSPSRSHNFSEDCHTAATQTVTQEFPAVCCYIYLQYSQYKFLQSGYIFRGHSLFCIP